jgi:hypothetical protein
MTGIVYYLSAGHECCGAFWPTPTLAPDSDTTTLTPTPLSGFAIFGAAVLTNVIKFAKYIPVE